MKNLFAKWIKNSRGDCLQKNDKKKKSSKSEKVENATVKSDSSELLDSRKQLLRSDKLRIAIIMASATLGVYFTFKYLLPYVYPFIFAYFVVVAITPIANFMNRKIRLPKTAGAVITLAVFLIILVAICCLIGCKLINQARMLLKNLPIYQTLLLSRVNNLCCFGEKMFGLKDGMLQAMVDSNIERFSNRIQHNIMPVMTEQTFEFAMKLIGVFTILFIIILAVILIIQDLEVMRSYYKKFVFYEELHGVVSKLSEAGIAYLRAQGILMMITAAICVVALFIIGNKYALLIGITIGIFDAFPVLGSGFILVPWAIFLILNKNIFAAAVILTAYLLCQLVRQFLEPKLLGNRIGIKPIFTLMSMYIGVHLFSFVGFILGPIALVLIISIIKSLCPELDMKNEMSK